MNLSAFGKKFGGDAGITTLMDDISSALSSGRDTIMMGGGNPANIPEIEAIMQQRLQNSLMTLWLLGAFLAVMTPLKVIRNSLMP